MVTRILFDPRRDLPDGSGLTDQPVIVEATPTGVREDGTVVILPTMLTFTINTSADLLQLAPTAASWKWRLTVRQLVFPPVNPFVQPPITPVAAPGPILQTRTVLVPDQTSIAYQSLQDVDPATLGNTVSAARNWDATFTQILALLALLPTDSTLDARIQAAVSTLIGSAGSALDTLGEIDAQLAADEGSAAALAATVAKKVPTWQPTTAYTAGTVVLSPAGYLVQAIGSFTSGASFNAANWTQLSIDPASVSATYVPLLGVLAAVTTAPAPTVSKIQPYDATSAPLAPPLPALSGLAVGAMFGVQKAVADVSGNTVTFPAAGSDAFDTGATALVLRISGELRILQVGSIAGTKVWKVVGGNTPLSATDLRYGRPTTATSFGGLPAPTGSGLEFVISASGLDDIRFNGTSL
jgi:hypothetical protein